MIAGLRFPNNVQILLNAVKMLSNDVKIQLNDVKMLPNVIKMPSNDVKTLLNAAKMSSNDVKMLLNVVQMLSNDVSTLLNGHPKSLIADQTLSNADQILLNIVFDVTFPKTNDLFLS